MNLEGSTNGNVKVIEHSNKWGSRLLSAITEVNQEITIQSDKKGIISILKNGEPLDIDIKKLKNIISLMEEGKFTISLEEYE